LSRGILARLKEKAVTSPSHPERRIGAERRLERRRGRDRFAADGWRYSGESNRRKDRDRRILEDRRTDASERSGER